MKGIVALAVTALVVGIVGGFLGNEALFYGSEAVAFVFVLGLWLYSLWKRPQSILDLDGDGIGDGPSAVDPSRAELELQRKNRGTIPAPK